MRYFILAILILGGAIEATAQQAVAAGSLTGRIVDSLTGKGVDYAAVSVLKADMSAVNGGTTDEKGGFELTNIAPGTYTIHVDFIGYKQKVMSVTVGSGQGNKQQLGTIRLAPKSGILAGVTVSGRRNIIENKIDKIVFNAANDITSQGGVAIDLLKKVPQVSVDIDGNVEVQGSSEIRFLIDGKPSTVFGSNITDVLASIPASQIQSIEVITSPGAKYDAEGTGGIINIILKKTTVKGISGSVALSAGTRLENGSVNLTARKGNIGFNGYLSGNYQISSSVITDLNRNSTDPSDNSRTELEQNGSSDFRRGGVQSGLGMDWDVTKRDNITASLGYRQFGNHSSGIVNQLTQAEDATGAMTSAYNNSILSDSRFKLDVYDWSVSYKKTFKTKGQELDIRYSESKANSNVAYQQGQSLVAEGPLYSATQGSNPGSQDETDISIDYTQPIGEKITIETGAKTELINIASTANVTALDPASSVYLPDPGQSYNLDYKSRVYAGYASGSFSLFNWLNVKAGLRLEHTDIKAMYSGTEDVQVPAYSTLVPSAIVSHDIDKTSSIKLSYSYRIERPDFRDLNPFLNLSDPHNISTGNPALRPEIGNKVELGYSKSFGKGGSIYATLFYNINTSDIKQFVIFYPQFAIGDSSYSNVSLTKLENIGQEHRRGGTFFASLPVNKNFSLRTNIQAYDRYIINTLVQNSTINSFEYRLNLNATYQFPHDLVAEAFGNFHSRRTGVQGKYPSYTSYNIALRKQFMHKNASLALTATNIFSKYIDQRTQLSGEDFTVSSVQQVPYRSFGVSFTYKFGKLDFKKAKEEIGSDDDMPG